jgi:hypothetical protein
MWRAGDVPERRFVLPSRSKPLKGVTVDETRVSSVMPMRRMRQGTVTMLQWLLAPNRRVLVIALLVVTAMWVWTGSHQSSSHPRSTDSTFIGGGGSGQIVRAGSDGADNSNSSSSDSGDDGGSAGSDGGDGE